MSVSTTRRTILEAVVVAYVKLSFQLKRLKTATRALDAHVSAVES